MHYIFINPNSSSGNGLKLWHKLEPILSSGGTPYREFILKNRGEAERLAKEVTDEDPGATLVAVGGDGTINEIVNGITDPGSATLAVIPTGSANDFCRGMNITSSPEEALRSAMHPVSVKSIDVGELTDGKKTRRFVVSAGMGFDAEVCYLSDNSRFKPLLNRYGLGKLVYTAVAVKSMFKMHRPHMFIRLDNEKTIELRQAYFAAFMNLKYEGGGYCFAPEADPSDGRINLCAAHEMPRIKALAAMPLAMAGKHTGVAGIETASGRIIDVKSSEPLCIHCDGEFFGYAERVRVRTCGGRLKVTGGE